MTNKLQDILSMAGIKYVDAWTAGNTLIVNIDCAVDAKKINNLFLAAGFDSEIHVTVDDIDSKSAFMVGATLPKGVNNEV